MELRTLIVVSPFLFLCFSLSPLACTNWYQSHSLTMAPEIRSSGHFSDAGHRLVSLCTTLIMALLVFSHLGFQELVTTAPSLADSTSSAASMILAPSDVSLHTYHSCSVPQLLRERIIPGDSTRDSLHKLAFRSKIETLSPGRCITIASDLINKNSFTAVDDLEDALDLTIFKTTICSVLKKLLISPSMAFTLTVNRKSITAARLLTAGHVRLIGTSSPPEMGRPLPRPLIFIAVTGRILSASSGNASFHGDYSKLFGIIIPGLASTQLRDWVLQSLASKLDSLPSAVQDELLDASFDPYRGFRLDHSVGTTMRGITVDLSVPLEPFQRQSAGSTDSGAYQEATSNPIPFPSMAFNLRPHAVALIATASSHFAMVRIHRLARRCSIFSMLLYGGARNIDAPLSSSSHASLVDKNDAQARSYSVFNLENSSTAKSMNLPNLKRDLFSGKRYETTAAASDASSSPPTEVNFSYASQKAVGEYKEARALGVDTVPVLIGPVSYLLLSKPAKGVTAYGFEIVHGAMTLNLIKEGFPAGKFLFAGVVAVTLVILVSLLLLLESHFPDFSFSVPAIYPILEDKDLLLGGEYCYVSIGY